MKNRFESRFMPNVKFRIIPLRYESEQKLLSIISADDYKKYIGFCTNAFGDIIYNAFENDLLFDNYESVHTEVSIYEAIPELVPDGFVYDRELDKLVSYAEYTSKDFDSEFVSWIRVENPIVDSPPIFKKETKDITRNKYDRKITGKDGRECIADVYDVLKAFDVKCPALQHLIKKALCVGIRGHKDSSEDLQDIIDSAVRSKELHKSK